MSSMQRTISLKVDKHGEIVDENDHMQDGVVIEDPSGNQTRQ